MSNRLFIGIAGGSGSGKTTLAERLAECFGDRMALLRHDDYYKAQSGIPIEVRAAQNFDHPDAFDTELLLRHLDDLRQGRDIASPIYNYSQHDRSSETREVKAADVILLEGILIFENPELRERLDIKIFVDTDADLRIVRRIKRDVSERGRDLDSVISQYVATVKPMHEAFVEPSKRYADIIVPEGGMNRVALDMIKERIVSHIENRKE
ncbi:MAG: uridine kinase [Ruminococcaceae bacterium]|nr:uridine kinase [Oscillospiraceae bacterium]